MQKIIYSSLLFPIFLLLFISIFFVPNILAISQDENHRIILTTFNNATINSNEILSLSSSFIWPTPGHTYITSKYGYRVAPATGASTFHGGIDIGAPQGSNIYAIASGKVIKASWGGANGYCVIINHQNGYESTYAHVNPNFVVEVGEYVTQGQHIANVGPKYVEQQSYTTYKDSSGKCTNGATTGPHLHFAISKDGKRINPQSLY